MLFESALLRIRIETLRLRKRHIAQNNSIFLGADNSLLPKFEEKHLFFGKSMKMEIFKKGKVCIKILLKHSAFYFSCTEVAILIVA